MMDHAVRNKASELLQSYRVTLLIITGINIGIFDNIEGKRLDEILSLYSHVKPEVIIDIITSLVEHGLIEKGDENNTEYTVSPAGRMFSSGGQLRDLAKLIDELYIDAWRALPKVLNTREVAFQKVHGKKFWDYLNNDFYLSKSFNNCMSSNLNSEVISLLNNIKINNNDVVVDVGAGGGDSVIELSKKYTKNEFIAVEQKLQHSALTKKVNGIKNISVFEGDMFGNLPANKNIYIYQSVLHNWESEYIIKTLNYLECITEKNARIFIIERNCRKESTKNTLSDLEMYVLFGSLEYSEEDLLQIIKNTKWSYYSSVKNSAFYMIEMRKVRHD